jgi:hypothetical protein
LFLFDEEGFDIITAIRVRDLIGEESTTDCSAASYWMGSKKYIFLAAKKERVGGVESNPTEPHKAGYALTVKPPSTSKQY